MFNRGTQRGRSTMPMVRESAVSLCRLGLPDDVPKAVALTTFDVKVAVLMPAAVQLALRVAGAVPWLTKLWSQGSFANWVDKAEGRNNSVMAGARIDFVRLARNCTSSVGSQRIPSVHVVAVPAMELSTRRAAPSNSTRCKAGMSCEGEKMGISVSPYTSLVM